MLPPDGALRLCRQHNPGIGIDPSERVVEDDVEPEVRYRVARRCSLAQVHVPHALDPSWPLLKGSPNDAEFDARALVWVADAQEGFVRAQILGIKDDCYLLRVPGRGEVTIATIETEPVNPAHLEKVEDMGELSCLSDAAVLHNLRLRYLDKLIYTYSGLFCVVVNPYERLRIYTESVVQMYMGKRRGDLPPHLFAVADEAYRRMMDDEEDQAVLVTGESGAGKTENTKKLISYLAMVGAAPGRRKSLGPAAGTLEEQIVQTNPVLEAFGNAKTAKNDNSSRFGKFIRVHFSAKGKVARGDIEHYLLEKSRVTKQAPGERSYHIFYQLFTGASPGLKESLGLSRTLDSYHWVAGAETTASGIDDRQEMLTTHEALDMMGFEGWEKAEVYGQCAAILHLGEAGFRQRVRAEQAEAAEDRSEVEWAGRLMGVEAEALLGALLRPRVRVAGHWVSKGQNLEQVRWGVEATAKAVYSRLFAWLVARCNESLDAKDFKRHRFIGVLDIAGFEIFNTNSFEQLWINFVNEKLQQFFNHHMFVREQEEYESEGIEWDFIDFGHDLQACIDLIEKPLGVVSVLDEECIVPKATDESFGRKLGELHLGKSPHFLRPRPPRAPETTAHFAIRHYAGTVRYTATGWLEKNKDPLNDAVALVLKAATGSRLMPLLWMDYAGPDDGNLPRTRLTT